MRKPVADDQRGDDVGLIAGLSDTDLCKVVAAAENIGLGASLTSDDQTITAIKIIGSSADAEQTANIRL